MIEQCANQDTVKLIVPLANINFEMDVKYFEFFVSILGILFPF